MGAFAMSVSGTARYQRGDIVVVLFPGSSANVASKRRPAVILAAVAYGTSTDYLCALITSQMAPDPTQITLQPADVLEGTLVTQSFLRPLYLFTAGEQLITSQIGVLASARLSEAIAILKRYIDPSETAEKPNP